MFETRSQAWREVGLLRQISPRVVKRARHNHYPVRKPGQHGTRHDARATIKLANPILTSAEVRTAA